MLPWPNRAKVARPLHDQGAGVAGCPNSCAFTLRVHLFVAWPHLPARAVACMPPASGCARELWLITISGLWSILRGNPLLATRRDLLTFLRPATRLRGAGSQLAGRVLARTSADDIGDAPSSAHLPGARKAVNWSPDIRGSSRTWLGLGRPRQSTLKHLDGCRWISFICGIHRALEILARREVEVPRNFRIMARIQHVARLGSRFCLETHLGRLVPGQGGLALEQNPQESNQGVSGVKRIDIDCLPVPAYCSSQYEVPLRGLPYTAGTQYVAVTHGLRRQWQVVLCCIGQR